MPSLEEKLTTVLNEGRILVLGTQVLVGFQCRAAFEPGFDRLEAVEQHLILVGLCVMLAALGLLLLPAAFHQIADRGEDTEALDRHATRVMDLALFPFAVGLGITIDVAFAAVLGRRAGVVAGVVGTATALVCWYGIEMVRRSSDRSRDVGKGVEVEEAAGGAPELKDKITHVLTEARMVLPGSQALLGFQFVTILMDAFERLPASSKYVHLASLGLIAMSIILLMLPAAYHRLVERGEDTEHFHRVASTCVVAAMALLAPGICGDVFVVSRKVTGSLEVALALAGGMLLFFTGLWFGYTLLARRRKNAPEGGAPGRVIVATG